MKPIKAALCALLGHKWRAPSDIEVVAIYFTRHAHVERCCSRCRAWEGRH